MISLITSEPRMASKIPNGMNTRGRNRHAHAHTPRGLWRVSSVCDNINLDDNGFQSCASKPQTGPPPYKYDLSQYLAYLVPDRTFLR